jgi:hypothetical protein
MSIKIDLANQVRQTALPKWKPLLPLFEAVINSFQAIKDANLPIGTSGRVTIQVERERALFDQENAPIIGFSILDNGIGLDDYNFDSFNTAFSSKKEAIGGKGVGRFTWLKAFNLVHIRSVFLDDDDVYQVREFDFDQNYDLDERGLPTATEARASGTTIELKNLHNEYKDQVPRSCEVLNQKLIEHFILVLLETECPEVVIVDQGRRHEINKIFEREYKSSSSAKTFEIAGIPFSVRGFRLPTSRTTTHKLVYAADQRAVTSDRLEEYLPTLGSRLVDENNNPFTYLAVVQSEYLSAHVTPNRIDFDFSVDDAEIDQLELTGDVLIPRADIRKKVLQFIEDDLRNIIDNINMTKYDKVKRYIQRYAPQYKFLLRHASTFLNKLTPNPGNSEIETVLHREHYQREVELKRESTRIIREAEKVDDYEGYHQRLKNFIDNYNELGVSALAQYVSHRKIILEFLQRAISKQDGDGKYPLERVVVFPMRFTSDEIPDSQQNLWMVDERLTFHTFIASDKRLDALGNVIQSDSSMRGDIVIFDENIIFGDVDPKENPINSITTIEFKRPGLNNYTESNNPVRQANRLVDAIRNGTFRKNGQPISVANDRIPAFVYCICDFTPSLREVMKDIDAFSTPDNQGYYGFHRGYNVYYEVIDYNKMLRDATKRNRIFFDKLNLVDTH